MTDRIVTGPNPGVVGRVAEWLFPWLSAEAAAARSGQPATVKQPEPEAEAGL